MAPATSRLLALVLLSVPLLISCTTCGFGEVYEAPLPEPEKCWECPEIQDAFEHGKSNIDRVGKSFDDFFCKYTVSVDKKVTYVPDKETERITQVIVKEEVPIYCYYGKDGRINNKNDSDKRCKQQAIKVPNCTPVTLTNYTGEYERCCPKGSGCALEAPGRCFHCPNIGGDFVDVDIKPGFPIECTYHGLGGSTYKAVTQCYYDPATGKAVSGYRGEPPCTGRTALAPRRDTCRDRLPTCPKDCKSGGKCWECPVIPGKVAKQVSAKKFADTNILWCHYKDEKEPNQPNKSAVCIWESETGKIFTYEGQATSSKLCPSAPLCVFDK